MRGIELGITVTSLIATTTKFGPLGGHLSESCTSKNVLVIERKEGIARLSRTLSRAKDLDATKLVSFIAC